MQQIPQWKQYMMCYHIFATRGGEDNESEEQ